MNNFDHQSYYCFAAISCVFATLAFFLKRVYFHPLSQFPGPKLAAASYSLEFYILWTGREKEWYRKLHRTYGLVVRCGPNHLSFNDPELIPIIYHRQADKINYPQVLYCPGAAVHKGNHAEFTAAKRQFGGAFSLTRIKMLEGAIDEQFAKWMSVLQEEATKGPLVNWATWASYFGFDVFSAIGLGESLGFLETKSDVRHLIENSYKIFKLQTLTRWPPIAWITRRLSYFIIRRSDIVLFVTEVRTVIQKHISPTAKHEKLRYGNSILEQWLSTRSTEGEGIPLGDIEDQLVTDLLGGPPAISTITTGLVFLMVRHPDVMKRARKEIDEAFASELLSEPSPSYDECCRLPFLSACVREGLRIVATASPRGRCSPDRSFILDGKYVPPGTAISTSPFEILRNEKLFGDNADLFLPDRWLQASEEQLRQWNTFDAHWGFGVRKCPGRHIGLMILYKTLVLLLRQFDLRLEDNIPADGGVISSSGSLMMYSREL